jgi:phosphate/sulfate permease
MGATERRERERERENEENTGATGPREPVALHALTRGALTTGANDVANSFSTAVASKTLTHRQAIILALFAEFTGAMVLGSSVTDTVRKKILDVEKFRHDPYVLMLGHKFSKNSP